MSTIRWRVFGAISVFYSGCFTGNCIPCMCYGTHGAKGTYAYWVAQRETSNDFNWENFSGTTRTTDFGKVGTRAWIQVKDAFKTNYICPKTVFFFPFWNTVEKTYICICSNPWFCSERVSMKKRVILLVVRSSPRREHYIILTVLMIPVILKSRPVKTWK